MPGLKEDSYRYIEFLTSPDNDESPRPGTLWPHQWEAFLRIVYSHEILGREKIGADGLLLNMVTGGGKTAIIAATIAWLRIAHDVRKFLLLCPNLVVRDRLEEDFDGGKVFRERGLLPEWAISSGMGDFNLTTLGSGKEGGWASLFSASVILGNIHQFYQSNKSGRSNLSALMNGPDFALFNDEAHNTPAPEYDAILRILRKKVILRLDTTATPERADGTTPDSDVIYEYGVQDALADGIIASPVVYQPDIRTIQLTYTDARTGEKRKVEEIDWAEVDRLGLSASQWVTDDEPMRQQMAIALRRLEEQERRAKGRYQAILFVIAASKADAQKAEQTLNKFFKVKTLLVTEDSDEVERQQARELGRQKNTSNPYKAVVSVLMLREGWDVPEVSVILLLRKFSSRVYGQQVVGRGLRRVRVKGVDPVEPQICAIVDHPKLEHQWLWDIFNAKKRENVLIGDVYDETEDLPPPPPKQELVSPDRIINIPPPDPDFLDDGEFDLGHLPPPPIPLEGWASVLDGITYEPTAVEITKVTIEDIVGKELRHQGWTEVHSPPHLPVNGSRKITISDEAACDAVRALLLEIAEELTVGAGYASVFKDRVYSALLRHVRTRFLNGQSLGLASRSDVDYAWKMLPQMKARIASIPGLVAGMIEYGGK